MGSQQTVLAMMGCCSGQTRSGRRSADTAGEIAAEQQTRDRSTSEARLHLEQKGRLKTETPSEGLAQLKNDLEQQRRRQQKLNESLPPLDVAVPQIILDCDPGGDDVVAIMWLLALQDQGACNVVALTTTEGNVQAPLTHAAADKVLALHENAGLLAAGSIDVCAQSPPLGRQSATTAETRRDLRKEYEAIVNSGNAVGGAAYIHGADGMGGLSSRLSSRGTSYLDAEESYERLIRELTARPGETTLMATGPLTNLADAERSHPGVLRLAKRIVIMGGALDHGGNITPLAEFNFFHDPLSAHIVLERAGLTDIVLMPLDVTTDLVCTEAITGQVVGRNLMNMLHTRGEQWPDGQAYPPTAEGVRLFYRDLSAHMCETNMAFKDTGGQAGFLVHDASCVAALFYPETLRFRRTQVQVVVEEHIHALSGFCFADNRHTAKVPAKQNCWVACKVCRTIVCAAVGQTCDGHCV
eukprot:SAG31_NODE_772_length_12197_cov_7.075963_16_plen_469_part_00